MGAFGYAQCGPGQLLVQDVANTAFHVYDVRNGHVGRPGGLRALRQQCYLFGRGDAVLIVPRFEACLYTYTNGTVAKKPLSKPGFSMVARAQAPDGVVFEVDTRTYFLPYGATALQPLEWPPGKESGWFGLGRWYYGSGWEEATIAFGT